MPTSKHPRTPEGAVTTLDGSRALAARSSDVAVETRLPPSNDIERNSADSALIAHGEDELWNIKAVVARTGLSRSSIYSYVAQGLFPRQRRLGPRRVGWLASEVRAWIASRPL